MFQMRNLPQDQRYDFPFVRFMIGPKQVVRGGGHYATFTRPKLFCGYRPHLLIDFDEILYGSLY